MSDDSGFKPFAALKDAKLKLKRSELGERLDKAVANHPAWSKKKAPARPKPAQAPSSPPAPPAPPAPLAMDEDEFLLAMHGVSPIGDERGRVMARPASPTQPPPPANPEAEATKSLQDLLEGRVEFELEYTDEFIQGHVVGLDPKVVRLLKLGKLSVEAHLDLHGMNSEQAFEALILFVREHYSHGKRCLLLIPGRGKNSPGGSGVLKAELQAWLTKEPLRRLVLAFTTAQPRHGGAGAVYVLLRKFKKSGGKVFWDKLLPDD